MIQKFKVRYSVAVHVILVFGAALAIPSVWAGSYVYSHANFPTGNNPAAVAIADFNGDHRSDLAVSNFNDNTISVLLGKPDGTFALKLDYPTGSSPAALVAADFNGDRKIDLAAVNENAATVSILLGNGDGTFQDHVDYPVGYAPVGIVAVDFNGDGKIDLAVVDLYDNSVAILLGDGDGTFQVQALISVGMGPTSLASGDFNRDGKTDLITSNSSGTVTVLLAKGDGSFTRVDSQSASNSPALTTGDFNGDGKLDAVVSSQTTQQVFLLPGKGDGSFGRPVVILNSTFSPTTFTFAMAGDFNRDGKLDVALAGIVVLLGNGDGTFRRPVESAAAITSFAAADLNGDGQLDLFGTDPNNVDVLLGNGNGTFGSLRNVILAPTVYGPDAGVAADFNGDRKLDLAVAETNFPNGQVSVELGNGNGTFQKAITSPYDRLSDKQ